MEPTWQWSVCCASEQARWPAWNGVGPQGGGVWGGWRGHCPQPDHRSPEGATGLPFGRAGQPGPHWEPQQRGMNLQGTPPAARSCGFPPTSLERCPWLDGQLTKPWSLCQAPRTGAGPGRWAAGWGNVGTPLVTTNHRAPLPAGKLNPGGKAPEIREAVNTHQNKYCTGVSHMHVHPFTHPLLWKQGKPGSSTARILWETETVDPACSPAGVHSPG